MKAILLSDSHGDAAGIRYLCQQAWQRTGPVDAYFHMGDGAADFELVKPFLMTHDRDAAFYGVKGNCDYYPPGIPRFLTVPFGDTLIYVTHGHDFRVKVTLDLLGEEAEAEGCTIALYGHTHEPAMDMGRVLMLNPGSVQDGRIGFLEVRDGQPRVQLWHFT